MNSNIQKKKKYAFAVAMEIFQISLLFVIQLILFESNIKMNTDYENNNNNNNKMKMYIIIYRFTLNKNRLLIMNIII